MFPLLSKISRQYLDKSRKLLSLVLQWQLSEFCLMRGMSGVPVPKMQRSESNRLWSKEQREIGNFCLYKLCNWLMTHFLLMDREFRWPKNMLCFVVRFEAWVEYSNCKNMYTWSHSVGEVFGCREKKSERASRSVCVFSRSKVAVGW